MLLLIVRNQTNFVRGRNIMDNVVIGQEVIHSMQVKKGQKGWMVVKIDMKKAYNRLKRDFTKDTLEDAKLPPKFIHIIMQCVSMASMQFL